MPVVNLSEDHPTVVTVHLAILGPTALVEMANAISDHLHDLVKVHSDGTIPAHMMLRIINERKQLRSLYDILRNHVELYHGEPWINEIRSPDQEAVA